MFNIAGAQHKSSTIQTPYAMMNYLISYFLTLFKFFPVPNIGMLNQTGGSYPFISVYLANPFTLKSKIASIIPRTDTSMRLGAG